MDCKHASAFLMDYLYQELDDDEAARIAGHLKACERCASEFAAFEGTRATMRPLELLEPPVVVTGRLLQQAAQALPAEHGGWVSRLRAGLRLLVLHPAMSAAVVLVVVVGISFYAFQRTEPQRSAPAADELVAPMTRPQLKADQPKAEEGRASSPPAAQAPTALSPAPAEPRPSAAAPAIVTARGRARSVAPSPVLQRRKARPLRAMKTPFMAQGEDDYVHGEATKERAANTRVAKGGALPPASKVEERESKLAPAPQLAELLSQAERASRDGNCERAFAYYARALKLKPTLSKTIGVNLQPCLAELVSTKRGEAQLVRANKLYPSLAPWLTVDNARAAARARAVKPAAPAANVDAAEAPAAEPSKE